MKNILFIATLTLALGAQAKDFEEVVLKGSATSQFADLSRQGELIKLTAYENAEREVISQLDSACNAISGMIKPNTLITDLQNGCEMEFVGNKTQATCQMNGQVICITGSTL